MLLALLELKPGQPWSAAESPRIRTVEIMNWLRMSYDKDYKPNTRETVRRQTLHQFVDAGLAVLNPDDPRRAVNSPHSCYQIEPGALALARAYGDPSFDDGASAYLEQRPGLRALYARTRESTMIPLTLLDGTPVELTPGGQNVLLKQMVEEFCPQFTPGGTVLYIGDAGKEDPVFEEGLLAQQGVVLDKHGKLPDLIVHMRDRDWLVLMEAASSHGPVDAQRYGELRKLFDAATSGLVFVSCFPSRAELRRHLVDIAWETEVWCADDPTHLIHFDGEHLLGPY